MQVNMSQINPVCVSKLMLLIMVMLMQSVRGMSWTDLVPGSGEGLNTYRVSIGTSPWCQKSLHCMIIQNERYAH